MSLYIRRTRDGRQTRYVLRESFWNGSCFAARDIVDLGGDPARHIVYVGGNGFYFSEAVEEAFARMGLKRNTEDLEQAFLLYLDPHIRRVIENFTMGRVGRSPSWNAEEAAHHQRFLHPFDKRRLHFLRCGRTDMGNLEGRTWKFLNVLCDKSRDEIEHVIEGMEKVLRPHEWRNYLFTALDLQKYFPNRCMKNHPAALDPEAVDAYFLKEICRLNQDALFFVGVEDHNPQILHAFLVKYVIMYFDHAFSPGSVWGRVFEDFVRYRSFSFRPAARQGLTEEEACACLGLQPKEYRAMSAQALARHYRKKAKKHHPDAGGDHETFIRLSQAYECLMRCKAQRH
ncbi:J domain-containing protein [Desulfosoma caldarium]|uniref:DnaJ-like protein n=1 Tax=Desulfosoma caldarium TaxID=610254 RepID=A0A3N1UR83_9BACT|nr:J domain-containing protein [Desulfosoma caldarium]ROQ89546.1 DnaJ-like protein [Desulfosoma caldarium]